MAGRLNQSGKRLVFPYFTGLLPCHKFHKLDDLFSCLGFQLVGWGGGHYFGEDGEDAGC